MLNLRSLEFDDLEFLLEVRNDESTRKFLGNDSIFTLKNCQEWFIQKNPQWLIIEDDNQMVGYIRVSDDNFPSICIGCDIHPNFRRKGYALNSYRIIIDNLFRKNYTLIWLEVFEDNVAARQLYEKLGFRYVSERDMRNKKYLRMELLKG
jgi:RimJ/RimL family protein N-acetyltransferase